MYHVEINLLKWFSVAISASCRETYTLVQEGGKDETIKVRCFGGSLNVLFPVENQIWKFDTIALVIALKENLFFFFSIRFV